MLIHCPSHKIFVGDDLQTDFTHIKVTNKYGATASKPITSGQASYPSSGSHQGHIFLGEHLSSAGRRITNFKATRDAITTKRRTANYQPVSQKTHHVIDKLQSSEVS